MKFTHPEKLETVLDAVVDHYRMRERLDERRAVALWSSVVGESVAADAVAVEAKAGVLRIRCHNAIIRQELLMSRNLLIDNINRLTGKEVIKDITFV